MLLRFVALDLWRNAVERPLGLGGRQENAAIVRVRLVFIQPVGPRPDHATINHSVVQTRSDGGHLGSITTSAGRKSIAPDHDSVANSQAWQSKPPTRRNLAKLG